MPRKSTKSIDSKIDELAKAVGLGFDGVEKRFDLVDKRFDKVDARLEDLQSQIHRIETYILRDHQQRLETIERKMGISR